MLFRDVLMTAASGASGAAPLQPSLLVSDGHVAWYTDPRGIIAGGALFYSTVSGTDSAGNIELHRLQDGVRDTWLLAGEVEVDDHNNASILELSDGKIACFYSSHTDTGGTRYRVSLAAAPNIGGFGPEKRIAATATKTASYSHPFRLSDGNVYLFRRNNIDDATGRNQQICVAPEADVIAGTATFSATVLFLNTNSRPYAKYVKNGTDRIDCFTTNGHPQEDTNCSIYHFYMQLDAGTLKYYKSDGTEITTALPWEVESEATLIAANTASNVNEYWTWEIRIGGDGHPRCLSTRYPTSPVVSVLTDIEYWHHRWTGSAWTSFRLSQNNISLYGSQSAYAPGLCFDGNDTDIVYMCENDAGTGIAEIKKYEIDEAGQTKTLLSTITSGSAVNNVRPFSPIGHGVNDSLIWIRTTDYTAYTDYEADAYILGNVTQDAAPASYETETTDLVARFSTAPSDAEKIQINKAIVRLKAAPYSGSNLWSKMSAIYGVQAHEAPAARLNWKAASNDLTVTGSPVFTANRGYKGVDGDAASYLSGPAPNALGAPYAQNSAHVSAFASKFAVGANAAMVRRLSAGSVVLATITNVGTATMRINGATATGYTGIRSEGFGLELNRSASNATQYYKNGGRVATNTDASSALDSNALIFAYQLPANLRFVTAGSSLTEAEVADLDFIRWGYLRETFQ